MNLINKYLRSEIGDEEFINNYSSKEEAIELVKNIKNIRYEAYDMGINSEKINNISQEIIHLSQNISELQGFEEVISLLSKDDIQKLYNQLKLFLPEEISLDIQVGNVSNYFTEENTHFKSIEIESYNIFENFKIDKLNKINIFAGFNNSGKTTLLEAIYLLINQNNMSSLFKIIKNRNKLDTLSTEYLNNFFTKDILVSGEFNNVKTSIHIKKFEANINKKNDYLNSYKIISKIGDNELDNIVHTFKSNPIERYYNRIEILCTSLYKSPYFSSQKEIMNTHSKNIELKVFQLVIEFLKNKVDKNINKIEFTEENNIKRFLVDSKTFPEKSVDITSYGEGLQRIFEIALSFAYCKNGVLLIDELETAIHYSLLVDFTKFIQELAIKFNVQVFITSHSKECIDAFIKNDFQNEDISAYLLENKENKISTKYIGGDRLKYLTENIGLDIRGNKNE